MTPLATAPWLWRTLLILAVVIATWDIWTRSSLIIAVVSIVATIGFGLATVRAGLRSRRSRPVSGTVSGHDRNRSISFVTVATSQAPAFQFARGFLGVILLIRFVLAPDAPLVVDVVLAIMIAAVGVLMISVVTKSSQR